MTTVKKLLLILLLLLMACPALAEQPGTVDMTGLGEVRDRDVSALIQQLENASFCDLQGVKVSPKTMLALKESCPQVDFHWLVALGKNEPVDSHITDLNLDELPRRVAYTQLREALGCFAGLEHVTMYNYRYTIKEMETLMAENPGVTFDWSIKLNNYLIRTDTTAFSTAKGRQDPRYTAKQINAALQHCPDLLALDLGHNNVSDLSFLTQWPKLRRLIIVDSRTPITDIAPLAGLEDLEYVELFMQKITDLSPLEGKTKLLDLNLCHNDITDLTPLYSCVNLERLHISYNPRLTDEEVAALQAALPHCVIETETYQSTEAGWRTHPRYFIMKESFDTRTYIPFE